MGEAHAQTIAGFAGLAVAYIVGKYDEILLGIEELAGPKQDSAKGRSEELSAGTAGAVQNQHGVAHHALRIFLRSPQCVVMQLEFRHPLAGLELEVFDGKIPLLGRRIVGSMSSYT